MNTVLNTVIAKTDDNTSAPDTQEKPVANTTATRKTPVKKAVAKEPVVTKAIAVKKPVKKVAVKKSPTKKTATKKPVGLKVPAQNAQSAVVKAAAVKDDVSAQKVKPKKQKMVRDSFTMPESEYQALGELKKSCLKQGIAVKKSELLRIGVATLSSMTAKQIETARNKLEKISAGRPKKD